MDTIGTHTAVLGIREGTGCCLARLLWLRRRELGTRRGRRALGLEMPVGVAAEMPAG